MPISSIKHRKSFRLAVGFLVFVFALSVVHNLFFSMIESFGIAGTPRWKPVVGFPTFFVPIDFSGCIVSGPRIYPLGLVVNLAAYFAVAAVVSRAGLFQRKPKTDSNKERQS